MIESFGISGSENERQVWYKEDWIGTEMKKKGTQRKTRPVVLSVDERETEQQARRRGG